MRIEFLLYYYATQISNIYIKNLKRFILKAFIEQVVFFYLNILCTNVTQKSILIVIKKFINCILNLFKKSCI